MMEEGKLRSLVRSTLVNEGFKIGNLSGIRPGDQIPLAWDLNDPHFVKKSADGDAYTSDGRFSSEFGGVFPIRSAFAFADNAPSRDNAAYPSHLEDVLEALKGKSDTVYTIPAEDMRAYIEDGVQVIAKSIIDDIDERVRDRKLPSEVADARISIYVTPSSSKHVDEYVEGLRRSLEGYIKSRFKNEKKEAKSSFSSATYKACAEKIKPMLEPRSRKATRPPPYFFEPYGKGQYKEAVTAARAEARRNLEKEENTRGTFPEDAIRLYKKIISTVNDCIRSINDFEPLDRSAGRLSSIDVDVRKPFRKIPVTQDPSIQVDRPFINQAMNQIRQLDAMIDPLPEGAPLRDVNGVDLSRVQKSHLEGLGKYITKRWNDWKRAGGASYVTVDDLVKDFEEARRRDIPAWRKKMMDDDKTDFSISAVPSMNRQHVARFIEADQEALPSFVHIAVIADDNMESGITLREMRRVLTRIENQPNPPLIVYGAPLLLIRGVEKAQEYTHEKSYTGRRKSNIKVSPPLSNVPESSELYQKIVARLAAMGNPNFKTAEPDGPEEGTQEEKN